VAQIEGQIENSKAGSKFEEIYEQFQKDLSSLYLNWQKELSGGSEKRCYRSVDSPTGV